MFDMEASPDKKKSKRLELLKRLIKEMDMMEGSEEEKDENPLSADPAEKLEEVAEGEEAPAPMAAESESPDEEGEEGGLSKEEIAALFKDKNAVPKKKGTLSVSMISVAPKKSFGKRFQKKG